MTEKSAVDKLATSVKIGFFLSVLSALASAYAAYQSAKQASYAREALSAADLNRSFETFYTSWTNLCEALDATRGRIIFAASATEEDQALVITATDFGYDFAPVDYPTYRTAVVQAIQGSAAAWDKLSLWISHDQMVSLGYENMMNNITLLSMVDPAKDETIRYDSIFRQVGYCHFFGSQFAQWFQHRDWNLPAIRYDKVRLDFKTPTNEPLNIDYIQKSRTARQL